MVQNFDIGLTQYFDINTIQKSKDLNILHRSYIRYFKMWLNV